MPEWISVKDRLPEAETEVFVFVKHANNHNVITTAMYEDGKMSDEESNWHW